MPASRRPVAPFFLLAVVVLALGCSEDLESGAACPALCPDQNVRIVDTTLAGSVTLDTTVAPYPALGTEPYLLVASRGDTVETRAVIRFDSLPERYTRSVGDTGIKITEVDSSYVRLKFDLSRSEVPQSPLVVEAYDVDTTAADTSTAAVVALFRPDRLVGAVTLAPGDVNDSLRLPLDNPTVGDKIANRRRIRIGLRVTAAASAQLRIVSVENASASENGPRLNFDPSPDTAVHAIAVAPFSATPADERAVARELADYTVVVTAASSAGADALVVGGLPARRAYLRFDVPRAILDSATVVRATLLLTQRPADAADSRDTFALYPQLVIAGVAVTEVARALEILGPQPGALISGTGVPDPRALDSIRIVPADSGTRSLEVLRAIQQWRLQPDTVAPHAIALRSALEGSAPQQAAFFSVEGPAEVRPQLRISYVPRVPFGLP